MKKITFVLAASLSVIPVYAYADVYVKVDANGVAIDGPIMCDSGTCGVNSEFSRLTLKPGERYVLQGTGQAGIGGNNPDTQVKVDLQTNVWTVTNTQTNTVTQEFTPQTSPGNERPVVVPPQPIVDTPTVKVDTATVFVDTKTVTVKVDTKTVIAKVVKKKQAKK
jgi:hypothetical protein